MRQYVDGKQGDRILHFPGGQEKWNTSEFAKMSSAALSLAKPVARKWSCVTCDSFLFATVPSLFIRPLPTMQSKLEFQRPLQL
jgi:hypothetical protein